MAAPKPPKVRLDKLMVDKGLCETRSQAQGLIMAGHVLINGQKVDKPGAQFPASTEITLKETLRYVSRGGLKLEHALDTFLVSVNEKLCLDVGASTGGFTDCLLQRGAHEVVAVDVGYGQLDWRLRQDPRVRVYEKTHIVDFTPPVGVRFHCAVIDVSFISLKKVLPRVVELLSPNAGTPERDIVALVKPQFEYRDYCEVKGFNGVVTDPSDHQTILMALAQDLARLLPGWRLTGVTDSPIYGPKGNREFFFHWISSPDAAIPALPDHLEADIQHLVANA